MKPEYQSVHQDPEDVQSIKAESGRNWKRISIIGGVGVGILVAALFALFAQGAMPQGSLFNSPATGAEKQGAGFLFVSGDQILLLERNSKHNDKKWGLPGGNVEQGDWTLLDTASREAREELGELPQYEVVAEIKTRRGKKQQKHYSVFVAKLLSAQQDFVPQLNEEHRSFQWFPMTEAARLEKLHPVVELIFADPYRKQLAAATSLDPEVLASNKKPKKLGAGLFFVAEGQALLLTRNSSHNNATLSVPGGNVDLGEKKLRETAEREAVEELGSCPEYEYRGEVDTWRGKHDQKEFKIFLAAVSAETKASFKATLDHESLGWGWYPLEELLEHDLHPIVEDLVKNHMKEIKKAFSITTGP